MSEPWAIESRTWMVADSEPARLRRGDPDAFDALLNRYQNRLFRYLLRLTGNPGEAEDLFQQTWLKVLTRVQKYDERKPFEPWLFAVARNLAIDHLRKVICPQCGSPLPRVCPSCHRPVEPVWPHCAHCGQKLHEARATGS